MKEDIKYIQDYRLVDDYLNGDKESGKKLYEKTYEIVKKYVYKYTANNIFDGQDQEDIIEDTMFESIRLLERYNARKCAFSTFVIGIAKKKILEKGRSKVTVFKHEIRAEFANELIERIPDEYNNPEYVLIKKEEIQALQQAFQLLSEDHRNVIQLRKFNKVSVKQVAQFMGKSESAVDSLYRRAITQLKNNFKKIY